MPVFMRKTVLMLVLTALAAGTLHAEEAKSPSVDALKQETEALGQSLKSFGADQKEQAEQAIQETLSAIDARINTLEQELAQNWGDMSELARERSQKSLQSLREQRAKVESWYGDLKASSASAWEKAKKGFSAAYDTLKESWSNAEQDIQSDDEKRADSI